jgi:hypothetical protein
MSADGNTIAVGTPWESSSATGINGDQTDNSAANSGAAYVFRFDGNAWTFGAYIKASNAEDGDRFGTSIALSADGNTLAVGAPWEDSCSTGINGDQYNDVSWGTSGAVYVYRFNNGSWLQQAYVKASNTGCGFLGQAYPTHGDHFGESIALSAGGDTLAVGAPNEDSASTGINGTDHDDGHDIGAAYVFTFDGTRWMQQAYIKPSAAQSSYRFGYSLELAASGDVLAVAASGDGSDVTGVSEPPTNVDGDKHYSGAAHLFRRDVTGWVQESYIKASNADALDRFGAGLALSADGNILAVGAPYEDSWARGVNGDEYDDREALGFGAVYLFKHDGINWYQQAYIKASNTNSPFGTMADEFGRSLALSASGDTLAVGARYEDSIGIGVNGEQYIDDEVGDSGAVYVFRFDGVAWYQQSFVKASNTGNGERGTGCDPRHPDLCDGPGDEFGASVALSADGMTLAVGATGEDSSATGIDGDQTDNSAEVSGAAYVY